MRFTFIGKIKIIRAALSYRLYRLTVVEQKKNTLILFRKVWSFYMKNFQRSAAALYVLFFQFRTKSLDNFNMLIILFGWLVWKSLYGAGGFWWVLVLTQLKSSNNNLSQSHIFPTLFSKGNYTNPHTYI